jgi:hypothetical protein
MDQLSETSTLRRFAPLAFLSEQRVVITSEILLLPKRTHSD